MLYLALSCLQGRLMQNAAEELINLESQGLPKMIAKTLKHGEKTLKYEDISEPITQE